MGTCDNQWGDDSNASDFWDDPDFWDDLFDDVEVDEQPEDGRLPDGQYNEIKESLDLLNASDGRLSEALSVLAEAARCFICASNQFVELHYSTGWHKDSEQLYKQCLENAESCRKDALYLSARSAMNNRLAGEDPSYYEAAVRAFFLLSNWRDSKQLAEKCQRGIRSIYSKRARGRAFGRFTKVSSKIIVVLIVVCVILALDLVFAEILLPDSALQNFSLILNWLFG